MAIESDHFGEFYSPYVGSSGLNVNPNTNSNSRASANAGSVTTKKKRRKPIKSCTFCRRRKLRCDQQKPMCSTCVARGLPECIYIEGTSTPHSVANSFNNNPRDFTPNTNLLLKVNKLEKQLQNVANRISGYDVSGENLTGNPQYNGPESFAEASSGGSSTSTSPSRSDNDTTNQQHQTQRLDEHCCRDQTAASNVVATDSVNPLRDIHYLQSKENGRKLLYGPTAIKTFIFSGRWGLILRYRQLVDKFKMARHQLKKQRGLSMLRENELIDCPLDFFSNQLDSSLIKQLVRVLPTYERMESILKLFFAKPDLYEISEAFDKKKVFLDFRLSFIPGIPSIASGERPVHIINPYKKAHYYKIGVIVGIVALVHSGSLLPPTMEKFFVYLSGLSTAKVMYVERVQYTLLRYFYRTKWGQTGGDDSHQIILVDSMVADALSLGLNRNIAKFFQNDESLLGSTDSLEKLWCWVLFLDFVMAFRIGRPLKLSEDNIFHEEFFDDCTEGFYGILKRFLKDVGRPVICSVFSKARPPDLNEHCEGILTFAEKEFLPISFYTNKELIHNTPFRETRILSVVLSLLLSLNGLKFLVGSEDILNAKNSVIKTSLVVFFLATNLMHRCIELDKEHFPDLLRPENESPPPYFTEALSMLLPVFVRGFAMPYVLAYHKLTLFEDSLLIFENSGDRQHWDLGTLRVPKKKKISTISSLSMFCEIFDSIGNDCSVEERVLYSKSHTLQVSLSMERGLRTVLKKVLECRATTENMWKTQVQRWEQGYPEKPFSPSAMESYENADLSFLGNFEATPCPRKSSVVDSGAVPSISVSNATTSTAHTDTTTPTVQHAAESNESFVAPLPKPTTNNTSVNQDAALGGNMSPSAEVFDREHDIFGMISDDFWESYNSRWAELLDSAESGKLFPDIDL